MSITEIETFDSSERDKKILNFFLLIFLSLMLLFYLLINSGFPFLLL